MVFVPRLLAYFTQHNAFQFHPRCCKGYKLLLSLCCIEFHCVNVPEFFDLSFADWHLGYFQYLAIVNCAAMNIGVYRFFRAIREMQMKITMRYCCSLVRKTITNKSTNHKCRRGCGETEPQYTVGGNAEQATTAENRIEFPQKTKNGTAPEPSNPAAEIIH